MSRGVGLRCNFGAMRVVVSSGREAYDHEQMEQRMRQLKTSRDVVKLVIARSLGRSEAWVSLNEWDV